MSLRQKLLLMFSLTVVSTVGLVAWTVSLRVRTLFDTIDRDRTRILVDQFLHEYQRRADEVSVRLARVAQDERVQRMGYDLAQGGEPAAYLNQAAPLAAEYQLDFLELVDAQGSIVSSAQWPAHFGYQEPATASAGRPTFLKEEQLAPQGVDEAAQTGLFAVRTVASGNDALSLVGGIRLDSAFLSGLSAPAGSNVYLYRNAAADFLPQNLIDASGPVAEAIQFREILERTRTDRSQTSAQLGDRIVTAIPLKGLDGKVLAVLLVSSSRRELIEAQQQIRNVAYGVTALGILLAVLTSVWIAAHISRPVEQLAQATRSLAAGDWSTEVPVESRDEIGQLAEAFNRMTRDLVQQRERLIQSERVAAWRELARRLAHELKNPLFPLQLTVENMIRARRLSPTVFEEVFQEGAVALTEEIANLKAIIGRFSDFSKMPRPQTEQLDLREVIARVVRFYKPVLEDRNRHERTIELIAPLRGDPLPVDADAELLHRALSNLVLNAIDAMPEGGTLTLSAAHEGERVRLRLHDTGIGMTPEECQRLFTPYYTTKESGTGLGLAIVQSVIADHYGSIAVESQPGGGTTFIIDLPAAAAARDKHA